MGVHYVHPGKDTRTPEQKRRDTPAPNIRTAKQEHSDCWRQGRDSRGNLGDVRYCKHGKIQVLIASERGGMVGPGTCFWSTLSPVRDWAKYRKAKNALGR